MLSSVLFELKSHQKVLEEILLSSLPQQLEQAATLILETLGNEKKILLCGNGGSAADAQHIAAEFTGRFKKEREGLAAIALTTDTSALTAIANDYGYEKVFSRQIEAIAHPGDLVWGISTSGKSPNILEALKLARKKDCNTLGFSGKTGGQMIEWCDLCLNVESNDTARIQEMHILFGHILCHLIDSSDK